MKCYHTHDVIVKNKDDNIALVYGETVVIATISWLGYNKSDNFNEQNGCFVLNEVDSVAIGCIPNNSKNPIQIMVFDGFGISKSINGVRLYDGSAPIDIKNIADNVCYQFRTDNKANKEQNHDGMVKNPITGRWSFL